MDDEYSYRKIQTTTNNTNETSKAMAFFQSIDSAKVRSQSLHHCHMSQNLKRMIDRVMENTH
jgi:hypothetical protein